MQTKLKKTLPLLIILTGIILTGVLTYGLSLVFSSPESSNADSSSLTKTDPTPTSSLSDTTLESASIIITISPTSTPSQDTIITSQTTPSSTPTPTNSPSPTATSTTTPTSTPAPTTRLQFTLQIDNDPPFDLEVDSSHNHCQVLETALAQGKLSSLNLKFFSSLSSYAVYQINGLGDTSQVWWTYSVNGQQPPYGCSQVMVNQGDVIHWTYAGPR